MLSRGESVFGNMEDFPESEWPMMQSQGIVSLAIVPVFAGVRWWGFIGFADCFNKRSWSAAELNALSAAAGIYGAALARREMEQRIAAAIVQEQLAAEIGEVLTASAKNLDEILQTCSVRIAHHLHADLVRVWTADRDGKVLRSKSGAPANLETWFLQKCESASPAWAGSHSARSPRSGGVRCPNSGPAVSN